MALWAVLALVLVSGATSQLVDPGVYNEYDWQWRKGRGTFYGTDGWNIHKGSCNYGYIWQDEPLGWAVAAIADVSPSYIDSCGVCVEVSCDPTWVPDNYGNSYDRTTACFDSTASLIVRITDTCPCNYPPNAYSNKRWYRFVPCTYQPANEANQLQSPTKDYTVPPTGQGRPIRDWPEFRQRQPPLPLFRDQWESGWWLSSWNAWVQPLTDSRSAGLQGSPGFCAKISPNGGITLNAGYSGHFWGKVAFSFWIYVGNTGVDGADAIVPELNIIVSGPKGQCNSVPIRSIQPDMYEPRCHGCSDQFWRWNIYFNKFAGDWLNPVINNPSWFNGCGGNGVWDLNQIQIRNDAPWRGDQFVCFDRVVFFG